jgi:hypothetical protein
MAHYADLEPPACPVDPPAGSTQVQPGHLGVRQQIRASVDEPHYAGLENRADV